MSFDDPNDRAASGRNPLAEPPGSETPGDSSPQRYPRTDLRRKVSLKFKEFQGFVNEYSENVSAGGMFIRTTSPQPVGTVFDFEFTLGDDYTLIHGLGEVVWVRERDEGFDRPPGMGVRFLSLDPGSRKLIDRMVAERLARGGDERGFDEPRPFAVGMGTVGARDDEAWWGDEDAGSARTVAPGADDHREGRSLSGPEEASPAAPPADRTEGGGPSIFEEPARPRGGPSPYIYSRTYQGAGYSKGGRRGRPLLVVLLIVVSLVAALAAFVLLAPETAQSWLMGGDGEGERLVARGPAEDDELAAREPVEPVAPEDAAPLGPPPAADSEDEAGDEAADGEVGFFSPAEEPEASPPERDPEPEPEPAPPPPSPAEEPASPPEPSTPFSRVLNVTWEERGAETLVTVHLDGTIEEWGYSTVRLGDPPRELVRIDGVDRPFPRPMIPVGTALVERVRLGFHPEGRTRQMHVVLDLADPGARIDRSEAAGSELRLWIAPGEG